MENKRRDFEFVQNLKLHGHYAVGFALRNVRRQVKRVLL